MALFSALQKFITKNGQPVEGASVLVKLAGSATAATVYATRDGGAKTNPFLTAADGNALCYVSPGRYDMTVTFNAEQVTFNDVEVGPVSSIGSFAAGGVVTDPDQLVEDADGSKWRWTGALNYTFAPGEDPDLVVGWVKWADAAGTTAALEQALAATDSAKLVGGKTAEDIGKGLFGRVQLLEGNGTNLLIRDESAGATRVHIEPKGYVDNGVTSKFDLMFDPYQDNQADYRIWNLYCTTGDPYGTGEGAIVAFNAKGTGNTWGLWPSVQFGFQDLGANAVCAKMWYGDHNQAEHFTPNKGNWRTGKTFAIGDYATNDNKIYRAATAGAAGATPPTHLSGTVSDGVIDWEFILAPNFNTVRATWMFGDRADMPILGYPNTRLQILRDWLAAWGVNGRFLDANGSLIANLRCSLTGGANYWFEIVTDGGGYKRFSKSMNYEQNIGLATASQVTTATNGATSINVAGMTTLRFDNAAPTTITNLTSGVSGQRLRLVSTNSNTTIKHEGVLTSGGVIKNASELDILMKIHGALDLERDVSADFWRVVGVGY